jgi:hypothetical protein
MHREIGKCNPNELYNILEEEKPEIIFEEFDISRTDDEYYKSEYYEKGHYENQDIYSIETIAIMRYLENHQVVHIPVDTYDVTYFPKDMYAKISNTSEEYSNLFRNILLSGQQGFSYLNSIECSNLFERLHAIEEEVVRNLNDEKLSNAYKSWQLITDNRDNEMVKNIYHYSENHCYNNAIFIIGAEHKKSILDKIQEYGRKNELKLNWVTPST